MNRITGRKWALGHAPLQAILVLLILLLPMFAHAQEAEETEQPDERLWLRVFVDSAFLRAEPLLVATPVGSVVEGESLQAVGRNADGTWFEARRAGSRGTGWIFNEMVSKEFDVWDLPLTSSAGADGPEQVVDTGLAVFVLSNTRLRDEPFLSGEQIMLVPHSVTIPVVGRNQDASWLRVNFNGHLGWIAESLTRASGDLMTAPLGFDLPPLTFAILIIPPELQLAQVDRLQAFVQAQVDLSDGLSSYWWQVFRGEILPCTPPPFSSEYQYTPQDIQQLPELDRFVPNLQEAVDSVNDSLEPLQSCGAYMPDTLIDARNSAINARLILLNILDRLDEVRAIIR